MLKSGGEFTVDHVALLVENINCPVVCLSDLRIQLPGVRVVRLKHGWPGWWSKIELFRPGVLTGKTLYLDLDTVVRELPAIGNQFTMLPNVYRPGDVGSGIMSWTRNPNYLYRKFCETPDKYMQEYTTRAKWGDQGFIRDHIKTSPELFGEDVRSYKVHCKQGVPQGTKIVYFHGKPRPWSVELKWLT